MSVNESITTYQHRLAFSVEGSEYGTTGRMQIEDEMKNPFGDGARRRAHLVRRCGSEACRPGRSGHWTAGDRGSRWRSR